MTANHQNRNNAERFPESSTEDDGTFYEDIQKRRKEAEEYIEDAKRKKAAQPRKKL